MGQTTTIDYWLELGFTEEQAAELVAQKAAFDAEREALSWADLGLSGSKSRTWRARDFKPFEASDWRDAGFGAAAASKWVACGFDSEDASD